MGASKSSDIHIFPYEEIAKPLGTRASRPQSLGKCGQDARVPRQNRRFCNYINIIILPLTSKSIDKRLTLRNIIKYKLKRKM